MSLSVMPLKTIRSAPASMAKTTMPPENTSRRPRLANTDGSNPSSASCRQIRGNPTKLVCTQQDPGTHRFRCLRNHWRRFHRVRMPAAQEGVNQPDDERGPDAHNKREHRENECYSRLANAAQVDKSERDEHQQTKRQSVFL